VTAPTPPTPPTAPPRRLELPGPKRERFRRNRLRKKKKKIAERVITFARDDRDSRKDGRARRLQRMAKLRMWEEEVESLPWPDASNTALPDIATASLIAQDALHNAVMSARPAIVSRATEKSGKDYEGHVDDLLDHQFFVEQDGEKVVEEVIQNFVEEGHFQALVAWVREDRQVADLRIVPRIPVEMHPEPYFIQVLSEHFIGADPIRRDKEGWSWKLTQDGREVLVDFYTRPKDKKLEMVIERQVPVADGPRTIVYEYDRCYYPPRSKNLQAPGPNNPGGASHVIFVDFPTVDELTRLQKKGFYDLIDAKDVRKIQNAARDTTEEEEEKQKDDFQGTNEEIREKIESHRTLTRYLCFDRFDLNGDGLDEDVVWWVLKEGGYLLKARPMTELYPTEKATRPIAEAAFLPAAGRREGISLPEFQEALHDLSKATLDQMVDSGTLANTPFGFYDPTGNTKPEIITIYPGDLYPMRSPKNNVFYPQFAARSQTFGVNLMTLVDKMDAKLTVFSNELNAGMVPKGKASALRNVGSIDRIQQAGEARPERVLRRFYNGFRLIFQNMHEFDKVLLPKEKQFRVIGYTRPNEDPYRTVTATNMRRGYLLEFTANVQNASRSAAFEQLQQVLALTIQPLAIQMGITKATGVYNALFDALKKLGIHEPERYIDTPNPVLTGPRLLAEEAISKLLQEQAPFGEPLEGAQLHLEKLIEFEKDDRLFATMTDRGAAMFKIYAEEVAQKAQQEKMLQLQADLAGQQQRQLGAGNGTGALAPPPPDEGPPPVQEGEVTDETFEEGA
jgi:hypothetical protein